MKKILIISLLLLTTTIFSNDSRNHFAISTGTEYLEEFYFNFGLSSIIPMGVGTELDIKLAMNMKTEKDEITNVVTPYFNVPIKVGINFLFPFTEDFTLLAGLGLSPTIRLAGEDKGFLIGPNIKAGLRFKIHPTMSIYTEACQSLLIGPPNWMYPSTELTFGVHFFI